MFKIIKWLQYRNGYILRERLFLMDFHKLREMVGRTDREARILRGWELYRSRLREGLTKEVFSFS